jgi:Ca2+-binding RTX toxin-like protein
MTPGALILLSSSSVAENSPAGKAVGTFSVSDPDFGDTFTFTLLDDAGGRFAIDAHNNLIVAGPLDYEEASQQQLLVEAHSAILGTLDETFIIKIDDVAGVTIRLSCESHKCGATHTHGRVLASDEEDRIVGSSCGDTIKALGGNDIVHGGGGNDALNGGLGSDVLFGNRGADRFVFRSVIDSTVAGPDSIRDFHRGQGDKIDLRGIEHASLGGDPLDFIGGNSFSGHAGELRIDRAHHLVQGDIDGDGSADFAIEVNVANLAKSDFLL